MSISSSVVYELSSSSKSPLSRLSSASKTSILVNHTRSQHKIAYLLHSWHCCTLCQELDLMKKRNQRSYNMEYEPLRSEFMSKFQELIADILQGLPETRGGRLSPSSLSVVSPLATASVFIACLATPLVSAFACLLLAWVP